MTTNNIFGDTAPDMLRAGLSVIPLQRHDKRPIPTGWSKYHELPPSPEDIENWLLHHSSGNIGMVLGRQSNIVVIDIDHEDEKISEEIMAILPKSPWERIGKKGRVLAYRYNGTPTFRIKDRTGGTIVEHLSSGTQVVLPPSIHPETKKPYTENIPLLEVLDELPVLPKDIETKLRELLVNLGFDLSVEGRSDMTRQVPAGMRDTEMTSIAGFHANQVIRGHLSFKRAVEDFKGWFATKIERVAGDDIPVEKGIENIVKFIVRDVVEKDKLLPDGWDEDLSDAEKETLGLVFNEDQVQWTYDDFREYLNKAFSAYGPETSERMEAIDSCLKRIANTPSMSSLDVDRLLTFIREASEMNIAMTSLRRRIKETANYGVEGNNHSEIADMVIKNFEEISDICFYQSEFWRYNGAYWESLPDHEIMKVIANEYGDLDLAKRYSDHKGILNIMANKVASDLTTTRVKGVNFANGVLLENGKLVAHKPEYGFQYCLDFSYDKNLAGRAFKFQKFLEDSWGHNDDYEDKLKALQEAMCMTIFGMGPLYQRAILLFGMPKTGKSQLLDIVSSLVSDKAKCVCTPEMWATTFGTAEMSGKILNVCGELSENKLIDGQMFKMIVAGEEITAQMKHKPLFQYRPMATHWFASNHLANSTDVSKAFTRRWLILEFDKVVENPIPGLGGTIVAEERDAIVAWAVEALPRLKAQGDLTLPASHLAQVRDMAYENNNVRHFVEGSGFVTRHEMCDGMTGDEMLKKYPSVTEDRLYEAYFQFCMMSGGRKRASKLQFRARMKEMVGDFGFYMHKHNMEVQYIGLSVKG